MLNNVPCEVWMYVAIFGIGYIIADTCIMVKDYIKKGRRG